MAKFYVAENPVEAGTVIYVDGSFGENGGDNYGWGMAVYQNGTLRVKIGGPGIHPEFRNQRNVAGEVTAAVCAVKWAMQHGIKQFTLCYDYEGVGKWAQGQWKAKNLMTQAYAKFMQSHAKDVHITYNWVKGHDGTEGNELADKLAKKGAAMPVK